MPDAVAGLWNQCAGGVYPLGGGFNRAWGHPDGRVRDIAEVYLSAAADVAWTRFAEVAALVGPLHRNVLSAYPLALSAANLHQTLTIAKRRTPGFAGVAVVERRPYGTPG